jgi:hypothetical protein
LVLPVELNLPCGMRVVKQKCSIGSVSLIGQERREDLLCFHPRR